MRPSRWIGPAALLLLSACGTTAPAADTTIIGEMRPTRALFVAPSRTITASPLEVLALSVTTVGPGEFVTPPSITGAAVQFIGMGTPAVQVPAGVTQVFLLGGATSGTSVVRFVNTTSPTVFEDTIVTR